MNTFESKIENLILFAQNIDEYDTYERWCERMGTFLSAAIDDEATSTFKSLKKTSFHNQYDWRSDRERQVGHLEGLVLRVESKGLVLASKTSEQHVTMPQPVSLSRRVFLVHGHDHGTKEMVARFIERLGLEPIILHEQPNEGRTIIEKFETYTDVGFAIVLLTSDDIGYAKDHQSDLQPRARQNVIVELGYFVGKLGRNRVSALQKGGIEIPTDLLGIVIHEIDSLGAWRTKVAQELVTTGFKINLEALLTT